MSSLEPSFWMKPNPRSLTRLLIFPTAISCLRSLSWSLFPGSGGRLPSDARGAVTHCCVGASRRRAAAFATGEAEGAATGAIRACLRHTAVFLLSVCLGRPHQSCLGQALRGEEP